MISFVRANARRTPGIERPERAAHPARQAHEQDEERRRRRAAVAELEGDPGRADRAEVELALGADVEELHPEGGCGGEPGEEDRGRGDERRRERAVAREAGLDHPPVRVPRVVAGRCQHYRHHPEGDEERPDGHDDRQPPRLV